VFADSIGAWPQVRPQCFSACPQPANQSSACYLRCFFDTMVGNQTLKVQPMDPVRPVAIPRLAKGPRTLWFVRRTTGKRLL
jgi:hypothetical protein